MCEVQISKTASGSYILLLSCPCDLHLHNRIDLLKIYSVNLLTRAHVKQLFPEMLGLYQADKVGQWSHSKWRRSSCVATCWRVLLSYVCPDGSVCLPPFSRQWEAGHYHVPAPFLISLSPLSLLLIYTTPFIPLTTLPRGLRELHLAALH